MADRFDALRERGLSLFRDATPEQRRLARHQQPARLILEITAEDPVGDERLFRVLCHSGPPGNLCFVTSRIGDSLLIAITGVFGEDGRARFEFRHPADAAPGTIWFDAHGIDAFGRVVPCGARPWKH
jgi:hypothetical protein